jgi:hypothetical protein
MVVKYWSNTGQILADTPERYAVNAKVATHLFEWWSKTILVK